MLSNFWGEGSFDDPHFGTIQLKQFVFYMKPNKTDGTTYREFNFYDIPYSKCKIGKNIHYPNEAEIKEYNIEQYYCPDWNNLTIQGNWHSPAYSGINLFF
jgi:hypothetical protein